MNQKELQSIVNGMTSNKLELAEMLCDLVYEIKSLTQERYEDFLIQHDISIEDLFLSKIIFLATLAAKEYVLLKEILNMNMGEFIQKFLVQLQAATLFNEFKDYSFEVN